MMKKAWIKLDEATYLKVVVIILPLMNFLSGISTDLYAPSLPAIANYFHVSVALAKNSISATFFGFALGSLLFGLLMGRFGCKQVIVLAISTFTLASFYAIWCQHIVGLLIVRFVQGAAIASVAVGARTLVVHYFTGRRFFVVLMYISLGYSLGPIVGPAIGGFLQYHFGWRANFYAYALMGIIIVASLLLFLEEDRVDKTLVRVREVLISYARIIIHPVFLVGEIIIGIVQMQMVVYPTVGPFLVQNELGYSSIIYGNITLLIGVSYLVGTLINRFLLHYFTPRKLVLGGFVLFALALGCQLILAQQVGLTLISLLIPVVLINLSFGFIFANILGSCLQLFPRQAAVASAIHVCISMLSGAVGIAVMSGFPIHDLLGLFYVYLVMLLCQLIMMFAYFLKYLK